MRPTTNDNDTTNDTNTDDTNTDDDAVQRRAFRDAATTHGRLMRDLWHATHCHTCGAAMHFVHNYVGQFCAKGCWRVTTGCDDNWRCARADCPWCLGRAAGDDYEPSLANSAHLRVYYEMRPMGRAKQVPDFAMWPTADVEWQARHGWDAASRLDLPVMTFPMLAAMGVLAGEPVTMAPAPAPAPAPTAAP